MIITRWRGVRATTGQREEISWQGLIEWISVPLERPPGDASQSKIQLPGWSPIEADADRRGKANVLVVTALVLDIDKGNHSLEELSRAFAGLQYVIHSTPSWTPEDKTWRMVVALSRTLVRTEFRSVWDSEQARLAELGIVIDAVARDESRFWFAPCRAAGGEYEWLTSDAGSPLDVDVRLTAWEGRPRPPRGRPLRVVAPAPARGGAGGGARRYADAALRSAIDAVRGAPEGSRNGQLNRESYSLGGLVAAGELSEDDVRAAMCSAGLEAGLGAHEVQATVESGLRSGMAAPRTVSEPLSPEARSALDEGIASAGRGEIGPWDGVATAPRLDFVGGMEEEIDLILDDSKRPEKIAENVARVLVLYPGGPPRWDEFAGRAVWPSGRTMDASDREEVQGWLYQRPTEQRVKASAETVEAGIRLAAKRRKFHPVRDWLSGLQWDGVARVDSFWPRYFGCSNEAWLAWAARAFLFGAVARVIVPGCKVDTMPIIEGPQGTFKSSALEALAGPQWFTAARVDLRSKDSLQNLEGKWLFEIREFEKLSKPGADAELKAFVDAATDRYRKPYAREPEDHPRQCVFAGTTNRDDYLPDPTGRRRYHPIRCGRIDLSGLRADREQVWAEAYARTVAGEQRWLPAEVEAEVERVAEGCDADDPWRSAILMWLVERGNPEIVTTHDVLAGIGVDVGRHDGSAAQRVAEALRREGYNSARNKHYRYWRKG